MARALQKRWNCSGTALQTNGMGEIDFDVVTEKTSRRGAHAQGVHRGESTAAPTTAALAPLVYQRAARRTRVRVPASLVCSAAPRVGRADRYRQVGYATAGNCATVEF